MTNPTASPRIEHAKTLIGAHLADYPDDLVMVTSDDPDDVIEIRETATAGYDAVLTLADTNGTSYYLAPSSEEAGNAAREYWADMAENDPQEFTCLVGEETLVQWGLGQYAGPGSSQVRSLQEWLDLWLNTPEEQWASWDGCEHEVLACSPSLIEELGFTPTVAYRC